MTALDPVTVYTITSAPLAQIIKNALEAEGIACVLAGLEQASVAALPGTTIQVQVPAADAERARALIESHEDRLGATVAEVLAELGDQADLAQITAAVCDCCGLELESAEVARVIKTLRRQAETPPAADQPPPENACRSM